MSDNNDKLDDLFKSRFDEVEMPVSDKLLANIKQELNAPKRKRRFGFWIWLVCGLVVVAEIINISMPYFKKEKSEVVNKIEIDKLTKVSVNKELNNDDSKIENTNTSNSVESENNNQQNAKDALNTEERTEVAVSNSTEKPKKNTVIAQNKKSVVPKDAVESTQLNERVGEKNEKKQSLKTASPSTTVVDKKNKLQKKETNKTQEKSTTVTPEKLAEKAFEAELKSNNSIANKEKSLEKKNNLTPETPIDTEATKENTTEIDSVKNNTVTNINNTVADTLVKNNDSVTVAIAKNETDTTKTNPKEDPKNETETPKSFTFFVELNGGPSQSFRILSPENNAIVKHRNTSEKATLSYNAALDFGVLFKNKYQISTGIGIDTKAEKYYYKGHPAEYYTYLDSFYVYDSIFDTTLIDSLLYIDTTLNTTLDSEQVKMAAQEKRIKNRYQYVKIPLMLGYRFNINERWFITPNAGVVVNYLISGNATWYDEMQQQYVSYNAKTDYRTLVFAARAKIDIGFNVKDKWSILLQPAYTRFLQSIYRKENSFKHLPYSYDVNVGVRYTF